MALKLKSFETENGILIPEGYFKLNNISYITYLPDGKICQVKKQSQRKMNGLNII